MSRILPVLERLVGRLKVPLSVDTSKSVVAEAAIRQGADLINDVTALKDPRMPEVIARSGVPVILMHMRGTPRSMQRMITYRQLVPEVVAELSLSIQRALAAGIRRKQILIDPGLGFGKRADQSLVLLRNLKAFKALSYPVVIGPSRKSFIGKVLDAPVEDRLFGTAAAVALGVAYGADMVRVHDVAAMRQVVAMASAIISC
jgi:dihydropteroate synthase